MDEYHTDEDQFDDPIEGYCVSCRMKVEIEEPQAVWTRKGTPATSGACSVCGATVFRMGKTPAHKNSERPASVEVTGSSKRKRAKLPQDTVYLIYTDADREIAKRMASELSNVGITAWLHENSNETVAWAGGVHPALKECSRMVYLLSPAALEDESLQEGITFFKEKHKPIVIAQIETTNPPDIIRRSPRFDFADNYKTAFRQMLQTLG